MEPTRKTPAKLELSVFGRHFTYCEGVPEKKLLAFLSLVYFEPDAEGDIENENCWLWMGSTKSTGYGTFSIQDKTEIAHRVAWAYFRGVVPEGMHLHHVCERPQCVNPYHLLPVTPQEHVLNYTPQSITAINKARTCCYKGHELSGDNVYVYPGTERRRCRTCHLDWERKKAEQSKNPRTVRTNCKYGHKLTPQNTYENKGVKYCRKCHMGAMAAHKERVAAAEKPKLSREARGIEDTGNRKLFCRNGHVLAETRIKMGRSTGCGICYNERVRLRNAQMVALKKEEVAAAKDGRCRRGHDLSNPESLYIHTNGVRECRVCRRLRTLTARVQALEIELEETKAELDGIEKGN